MRVFFESRLRWPADDPAIDECSAGFLDDACDAQHGCRIEGITVDINRLFGGGTQGGCQFLGQPQRAAGWQYRQNDVAGRDRIVGGAGHAGCLRASQRVGAASFKRGADLEPAAVIRLATALPIMPGAMTATIGCMAGSCCWWRWVPDTARHIGTPGCGMTRRGCQSLMMAARTAMATPIIAPRRIVSRSPMLSNAA